MKIIILLLCLISSFNTGCSALDTDIFTTPVPQTTENKKSEANTIENIEDTSPTPQPKISSDFENAPNPKEISEQTNKDIAYVLLQDTLTYDLSIDDYFAVCLEEDAEQGYRWLWVNESPKIEYVEETHINGYRVFIFKPIEIGETSILFELSQEATVIETLSYLIIFS